MHPHAGAVLLASPHLARPPHPGPAFITEQASDRLLGNGPRSAFEHVFVQPWACCLLLLPAMRLGAGYLATSDLSFLKPKTEASHWGFVKHGEGVKGHK